MIGRKLGNRYEVIERIGGGGMAVVYRALDTLLNRNVSIKALRAQFSTDDDFVRRFRREAQAAASLSHPNVVNIYDVGVEGEDYYIVMEYVDGLTLKEVIQDRAPLPVGEAIDISKQICAALGHAHENNIVHRDIKPHNILIGKDGRVKVTDFGIARAITSNTITQDGSVLGSVHYFSPEQARGGITDVKSDIYSLGVVLYEMVTGELPFSGETPISVALKHLQDHFVEPRQINSALPQSVENIILKALAKDPTVRYQTAREMYRDLEKALLYPNVPKFVVPLFDEQQTIQMPAVGLRSSAHAAAAPTRGREGKEPAATATLTADGQALDAEQPEKKKRKFWRPVIWLLAIFLLLGVGAVTAYTLVTNYMGVKDVTMPNVVGETYDQAVQDLVKAGLDPNNIHRQNQADSTKPPNTVLNQDQYAGKTIKANREVTLTVASGPQKINLPNVISMSKADAVAALKSAGIPDTNISTEEKEDSNSQPGMVLDQTPKGNTQVDANSQVKLIIAKAIPKVTMPDLAGKTVDDAKNILQQLGLTVGNLIPTAPPAGNNVPKDHVIRTGPYEANAQVQKGTAIDLYVSTGMPGDASGEPKKKTTAVTVDLPPGESKVQVRIMKSDALGQNQVVVSGDEITQRKTYNVDCVLKPDTIASIQVYLDGQLTRTIPVTYDDSTGGTP